MPDLKHFNYAHLPAHLQPASKPFYDFVHAPVAERSYETLVNTLLKVLPETGEEVEVCYKKIFQCTMGLGDEASRLRLLLEAKDCAVRALLP